MAQKLDKNMVIPNVITTNNTGDHWNNKYYVGDPPYAPDTGQTAIKPGSYQVYGGSPPATPIFPGQMDVIIVDDPHLIDLIEMLELEETTEGQGLRLQIDGKQYSLIDIMYAQMKFMFRMNVLLIHRQLGRTNED